MNDSTEQNNHAAKDTEQKTETAIATNTESSHSGSESATKSVNAESNNQVLFGVLAYIGPLVIIPFLMAKDDKFVHYHVKQGLVLFCAWLITWVIAGMFWLLIPLVWIMQLVLVVLSLIGISHVLHHKTVPLPLLGKFAEKISI